MSTNTPQTPQTPETPNTPQASNTPEASKERTQERTRTLAPQAPPAAEAAPVVRGPYVAPVILGLVCLVIAAAAFAQEFADWTIDWGNVGPLGIVVAGVVLVLLGGVGLLTSRRRRR